MSTDRWITARAASRILAASGVPRQQSRRVLTAGLAGPPLRTPGAVLHREAHVRALAGWTPVDHGELSRSCPGGMVVARLGPGREPEPAWSWDQRVAAWRTHADVGLFARMQVAGRLADHGTLPFVVTLCGYPLLTADLTDVQGDPDDARVAVMDLAQAGPWTRLLERRRLVTSPGPPWLLIGAQPYLGRAARAREARGWRGDPRRTVWTLGA
jgi:hypothetical protein